MYEIEQNIKEIEDMLFLLENRNQLLQHYIKTNQHF